MIYQVLELSYLGSFMRARVPVGRTFSCNCAAGACSFVAKLGDLSRTLHNVCD